MNPNKVRSIMLLMAIFFSVSLSAFEVDGIEYCIYNGGLQVQPKDGGYSGDIIIPEEVSYNGNTYKVTSIYGYKVSSISAFYNCTNLTSITIPKTITSIGENAFYGCSRLAAVKINDLSAWCKISFGGRWANPCCYAHHLIFNEQEITNLTIPNDITEIKEYAFQGCSSLTSVNIPNSVTKIEASAFEGCSGLKSITIPNSVTSIGKTAFYGCSNLTSVFIPKSVTSIYLPSIAHEMVFGQCLNLTSIVVESGNPKYDSRDNCNAVINTEYNYIVVGCKNTVIPQSVTSIGSFAYNDCDLASFIIPNHVVSVGANAFSFSHLKTLVIGSGVENLGSYATRWTISADKIIFLPSQSVDMNYTSLNYKILLQTNSVNNKAKRPKVYPYLSSMFEVDGMVYVPVSPSERTCNIIDYRYYNSKDHVDINESVKYNGIAFSVNEIAPFSFYNYDNIRDLKLNVNGAIGKGAFSECHSLSSVELGNDVTSIYEDAFKNCDALASLKFGNNIASIGTSAFYNCSSLKSVDIPNSVTNIDKSAFYGCSSLNSAKISDNLEIINDSTFYKCTSLNNIEIGEKVKIIEDCAFSYCSSLESIVIPQSVTELGTYVFSGCQSLKILVFEKPSSDKEQSLKFKQPFSFCPLDSVYLGRKLKDYYILSPKTSSPFSDNKTLRAVYITDNVDEISENEFYGCTNLKRVSGGEGLTKVGKKAFSGCSHLESFTFEKNVAEIGSQAFEGCSSITMLICKAATPPTCRDNALTDINKWNSTLYVPANSISLYQAADQWKDFFFIESIDNIPSAINSLQDQQTMVQASDGNIEISGVVDGVLVTAYSVDGKKLASTVTRNGKATLKTKMPKGGMAIVRVGDKVMKIVMK